MIIKKFQGKTKEEALQAAYAELGPNVVEMNTRNVKRKGLFSFLLPQIVEVTVALEDEVIRPQTSEIVEAIAGVRSVAEATLIKEENERLKKGSEQEGVVYTPSEAGKLAYSVNSSKLQGSKPSMPEIIPEKESESSITGGQKQAEEASQTVSAIERLSSHRSENRVIEEKLDSLHTMLEEQLSRPERPSEKAPSSSDSKEEIRRVTSESEGVSDEVGRFVKLLYNTMIENEINEKYANQIIEEMEKNINPNTPFEMALANIYQKMILKFGNPEVISPASKGPKMVFFVGPTGVGKTTTIAKIASKFSVEKKKKVALLTADTYRIAAAEQLHTYANILEIPFRVIYSIEEVENSLTDFKDFDYILVDTAGHSHHNEAQREIMNGFIHSVDGVAQKEVFLVLSATTKYRDLLSIADTYSSMTNYKLIFTKLDETTTLGNLLNVKLHTGAPLSYVTCGQNVPDDIEEFNPQKTVKQLLGGRKA